jgi:hypothetical protein
MSGPEKQPNLGQRILIGLTHILPAHKAGLLGLPRLLIQRELLRALNLYPVELDNPAPPTASPPDHRYVSASPCAVQSALADVGPRHQRVERSRG